MLVSEKLAIAAHLHVLLRRKTGRVTDTEWMAQNLDYALEIARFARAKAVQDGHPDLADWAAKLENAIAQPSPASRPLAQSALQLLKAPHGAAPAVAAPAAANSQAASSGFGQSTFGETGFADSALEGGKPAKPRDPNVPRYVGGIR